MIAPEARARQNIDRLLEAAGWIVQDRDAIDFRAGVGIAVREFALKTGSADYLLFVDRKMIGVVEAKPEGTTLSGVEPQAEKYSTGLPDVPQAWRKPLPFLYQSTGVETFFTNGCDPDPRSRPVFAFHRPETLREWINEPTTFRSRLQNMPPLLATGLWPAQFEAIRNLEVSLAADRPRALIQMATGSGKTVMAISSIYRLLKFANARRVLFLVDRSNLGRQTLKEFQAFATPDDGRKFTELYNVQRLTSNALDSGCKVTITTIQRLFSILSDEPSYDPANEEPSWFELDNAPSPPKVVRYNPKLPIEYFDVIVVDECHRSIYNQWRQVLDYFDAHVIGLTATPAKQTFGYSNQNLVMEYSRERAVADGVNVDGQVYRIKTQITEQGSTVDAGYIVDKRNRLTRQRRWERLDDDFDYTAAELDRLVVSEDQIRTIIRTFRDKLFTEIFPGRREVPKTLIFAKDDSHAEDIVRIVRDEFGKGNDFCQKITYRVTGIKAEDLIATFRNSYNPRIAVTVDMIATGTDIRPLEVLLFLRPVKSRVLFEQMLGRGTRIINRTDLQAVTPDATLKDRFVIVDAVGVLEQPKIETQTLERKRTVPFDKLLHAVSLGDLSEDTLSSLVVRLSRLDKTLGERERAQLEAASGGLSLRQITNGILDALDPDRQIEAARAANGGGDPTDEQIAEAATRLIGQAAAPFDDPAFRQTLVDIQRQNEQTIDTVSQDKVLDAGYSAADTERARSTVQSFRKFIEDNKDEITALQVLYNQPYGQRSLTYQQIQELAERIKQPPNGWTPEGLWRAYAQLEKDKVRGLSEKRVLTDLVALVRHAVRSDSELVPYPEQVQARYRRWLAQQEQAGKSFTPEQRWWLDRVAEYVGVNLGISPEDFEYGEFFNRGGRIAAIRQFGRDLSALLSELNTALVA